MKTPLILLCSAALFSTAALANESDSRGDRKDVFASLDADADGQLSKDEVASSSSIAGSFTSIDRNGDGYISKGEFRRNVRSKPDRTSSY